MYYLTRDVKPNENFKIANYIRESPDFFGGKTFLSYESFVQIDVLRRLSHMNLD